MNDLLYSIIKFFRDLRNMDRATLVRELREIAYHAKQQVFGQIPGVSAIIGILVGSWVASTFTSSPIKGFLSSMGLMKGGTHVVSGTTYKILSIGLPLLATVVSAYAVQKILKIYRLRQLERNMAEVTHLKPEVQAELQNKLGILDIARKAELISESEYQTKKARLYQSCTRTYHSEIQEILMKKLEG